MSTIFSVVKKYQEILSTKLSFTFSNRRPTLGKDGEANRFFLFHLCNDKKLFIDFLKETGLIISELKCDKCEAPMNFAEKKCVSDGFVWYCNKRFNGKNCSNQKSIRKDSWFFKSKLKLEEIFLLNYEIVRGTKTRDLEAEYYFGTNTLADWRKFINDTISEFVDSNSDKIGGSGKIVEVGISNFGKKKYINGNLVSSQLIFGVVERDSGKLVLEAIYNKSQEMLVDLIKKWIEEGTKIYFDNKSSRISLGDKEFKDLSINYNITYTDTAPECHTNTIKCIWRHVESKLPTHNRQGDFKYYISMYLFNKYCEGKKIDTFNTFLELIRHFKQDDKGKINNLNSFLEIITEVKQKD